MKNSTAGIIVGMALTMASGVAVGMMGKKMIDDNKRILRRKANKVADTVENIADTTRYMFK